MTAINDRSEDGAMWCPATLPWAGTRSCTCKKPNGHRGVHECLCGEDWENAADNWPCPSTEVMVLGSLDGPVRVRCGLQEGHGGAHRIAMEWKGKS